MIALSSDPEAAALAIEQPISHDPWAWADLKNSNNGTESLHLGLGRCLQGAPALLVMLPTPLVNLV